MIKITIECETSEEAIEHLRALLAGREAMSNVSPKEPLLRKDGKPFTGTTEDMEVERG